MKGVTTPDKLELEVGLYSSVDTVEAVRCGNPSNCEGVHWFIAIATLCDGYDPELARPKALQVASALGADQYAVPVERCAISNKSLS